MLQKILKTGFAGCLAVATACTGFAGPAQALPLLQSSPIVDGSARGNVTTVQYLGNRRTQGPQIHGNRPSQRQFLGQNPPPRTNRPQRIDRSQRHHRSNRGFYRHNGRAYYNGHRGYRHQRRGYRRYNGWWFPLAAFTLGTIIGPGYNYPSYPSYPNYRPRGLSQAHYNWCHRKYRSYRAYDNTFQPYHGPRKACRSPY
ncbi:BA14K family protein [uncultured Roseibium sp.]|uniref:BA14K family protein n=1 Tax=uncultured Roseibium sp. TaxID=1936171 RepID=UPI0032180E02